MPRLLARGTRCGVRRVEKSTKQLLARWPALWSFALHAGVEPTNNEAERALRAGVIWRKTSFGSQSGRGLRLSPGILFTPLARDELSGPRGAGYRRMLEASAAGRSGTPDEMATIAARLMGPDGAFIVGSDFLMDGGVTAAHWHWAA